MQQHLFNAMRGLNMLEGCKSAQVFALNPAAGGGGKESFLQQLQEHLRVNSVRRPNQRYHSFSQTNNGNSTTVADALAAYGHPQTDLIEPQIDPFLKFVDFVEILSDVYRRLENCPECERSEMYIEQCAIFRGLPDPKLFRRCLRAARQHAVDVHSKVVLSAWLRYERREDELLGVSAMDCSGWIWECPKSSLVSGYNPESANDSCSCFRGRLKAEEEVEGCVEPDEECSTSVSYGGDVDINVDVDVDVDDDDYDMWFCIGEEEVRCNRFKFSLLSRPFKSMLYGNFAEAKKERIYFAHNGISSTAIRAAEVFSRIKSVDSFSPNVVLELLSFANRFCCDELKYACDVYLASLVDDIEIALQLIDYGLEDTAYLLVAACLQIILREPSSSMQPNVLKHFSSPEAMQRLASVGHVSFLLYSFLSLIAMEENMKSNTTVMLLERMGECATKSWQKQLAFHQLGCVMLERKEYKDSQKWFEAAFQAGHVYSLVGVARGKNKRGHTYKAFKLMNSLVSDYNPCGWMYQERSLYSSGREKMMDLNTATDMDPTLSYPYKYRAVSLMEEDRIGAAISEVNRIIGFKVSPDCLELRAWFLILLEDYEGALTDVRGLLTLDPHYVMFNGKLLAEQLVELLCTHVEQRDQADCWMQLYDRWSSVDDIGSLAVIHHMLDIDPGKSLLRFRQSLLLLRLNCHKAAMRSLRMARNHAASDHERLIYEGWILYDTGYREAAIAKAEESISLQRSFEAFFLKAYVLSETTTDHDSSNYVIQLLEEALRCPSDGLRKGQALSNLASIYVDVDRLDNAVDSYMNALNIKHTRAHQGLARVYHLKNLRKAAYDEMTKLIEKARYNASAYEKRSEYCDREMAKSDLSMATRLDPLRTYPYRYRAAVLMDDHKEAEAIAELTKAIAFKPDLQLLHLRSAFLDSVGDYASTIRDCEAALCLDPNHSDTIELYKKAQKRIEEQ